VLAKGIYKEKGKKKFEAPSYPKGNQMEVGLHGESGTTVDLDLWEIGRDRSGLKVRDVVKERQKSRAECPN